MEPRGRQSDGLEVSPSFFLLLDGGQKSCWHFQLHWANLSIILAVQMSGECLDSMEKKSCCLEGKMGLSTVEVCLDKLRVSSVSRIKMRFLSWAEKKGVCVIDMNWYRIS